MYRIKIVFDNNIKIQNLFDLKNIVNMHQAAIQSSAILYESTGAICDDNKNCMVIKIMWCIVLSQYRGMANIAET